MERPEDQIFARLDRGDNPKNDFRVETTENNFKN